MQLNDENLNGLRQYLEQTFSPDAQVRQAAEKFLKSVEHQQGYPILILKLIEQSGATPQHAAIRQAAAVLFKNYVKNNWDPERDVQVISEADRHVIKTNLITLMCSVPDQIQRQLSAALSTIGEYDFPEKWQNLLPELVQKLSPDWRVSNGVLLTANTIFKRFRHAFRSDELYKQLKHCLEQFQVRCCCLNCLRLEFILNSIETAVRFYETCHESIGSSEQQRNDNLYHASYSNHVSYLFLSKLARSA